MYIYFKTFFWILIITFILYSGLLIGYYGVNYYNLLYIICPGIYMLLLFYSFDKLKVPAFNISFLKINFSFFVSYFLLALAVFFSLLNFNTDDLFALNFAEIRSEYIDRDVTVWEQLAPIFMIYPFCHFLFLVFRKESLLNIHIAAMLSGFLIIALTTGGRQIMFQILVLIFLIKGAGIFKKLYVYIILGVFILLASLVTLGRNDHTDITKAQLLENVTPAIIHPVLKPPSNYPDIQEVALETSFYFGHQVPAFCAKIDNLKFTLFPRYSFAMQPFLERQLIRVGILNYTPQQRYDEILDLSDNTDFFRVSWSTGFLDIYFNLGIIGSFLFFSVTTWILYNNSKNLQQKREGKFVILKAMNILFIITMFMTPLFMDTTIFYSYLLIFLSKME